MQSWLHSAKIHILEVIWWIPEVIWTWVLDRLMHLKRPIVLSRQWLTREAREPTKCKVTAWKRSIYRGSCIAIIFINITIITIIISTIISTIMTAVLVEREWSKARGLSNGRWPEVACWPPLPAWAWAGPVQGWAFPSLGLFQGWTIYGDTFVLQGHQGQVGWPVDGLVGQ